METKRPGNSASRKKHTIKNAVTGESVVCCCGGIGGAGGRALMEIEELEVLVGRGVDVRVWMGGVRKDLARVFGDAMEWYCNLFCHLESLHLFE